MFNVGYGKPFDLSLVAKKIKKLCKGGAQSSKKIKLRIDEPKNNLPQYKSCQKSL